MPWLTDKRVTALWVNHENANSWAVIDGAWRKFNEGSANACTNMTIAAAHAKEGNRSVNIFVEGDRVKEIYVW